MLNKVRNIVIALLLILFTISCIGERPSDNPNPIIRDIKPVSAVRAHDFINSIGVNTHFGFWYSSYADRWEDVLKPRLIESGIKHIRDGYGYRDIARERFQIIGQHGIKLLYSVYVKRPQTFMEEVKFHLPMLSGVEAINEIDYDAYIDSLKRPEIWAPEGKRLQKQLWDAIKGDPETSHLPVVGLSVANIIESPAHQGDISQWMDYGNIHPYTGGAHPSVHWGWGLNGNQMISQARIMCGNKPIMATEAGYHNYLPQPYHPGTPENIDAIYTLHLFFEYFNMGIARTYLYEFMDIYPDQPADYYHFGMISFDGTPKPVFYAVKNLIALLKDEEIQPNPESLPYEVTYSGLPQGETLSHTLLHKSDGSWWIAFYHTTSIYDRWAREELPSTRIDITLSLDRQTKEINLYLPNESQSAVDTYRNTDQITFGLDSRLTLIRIDR